MQKYFQKTQGEAPQSSQHNKQCQQKRQKQNSKSLKGRRHCERELAQRLYASTIERQNTFQIKQPSGPVDLLKNQGTLPDAQYIEQLLKNPDWNKSTLTIVIVGASGDLAQKKIFPALFATYFQDQLPKSIRFIGYARSKKNDEEFRDMILSKLTCRIDFESQQGEECGRKMDDFLENTTYVQGNYDSIEDFQKLDKQLNEHEDLEFAHRIFYLSIPPKIFTDVVKSSSQGASSKRGWTRFVVEKPFGKDLESSRELDKQLSSQISEEQIFRIDHYLGKELIENLTVLRFANIVFQPLWSRQHIRSVQLIFSENFGVEGRAGYFDQSGIIRDVMQNHMLQILTLFAMEQPASLRGEDVRNEKVKVLNCMEPINFDDVAVGQYKSANGKKGYLDDKDVDRKSVTPTFAAMAFFINNSRWDGVPFLMKAGKALHERITEVRVQFRHVPGFLYSPYMGQESQENELIIRIQPEESVSLKILNKVPGLGMNLAKTKLDLSYQDQFEGKTLPDAYERLILDVVDGDKRLFIRSDELDAAWRLFTPVLHYLEDKKIKPEQYPYGSSGPINSHYLASKYNIRWGDV